MRQWMQLEQGTWVPQHSSEMEAIAVALDTSSTQISFGALLSFGREQAVNG
jgi:hypothetical protein